jgi:diguanylate cyclase (GGDEF)-like protein
MPETRPFVMKIKEYFTDTYSYESHHEKVQKMEASLKNWIVRLMEQLDPKSEGIELKIQMSEERATLLFLLDLYCKNSIETDTNSSRKIRDDLDGFAKELLRPDDADLEKTLFRLRQYFTSYRVEETTYVQKTLAEFRRIIWEFAEQLSQDEDSDLEGSVQGLREAVESNSVELLKKHTKGFLQTYMKHQEKRQHAKTKRMDNIRKNLNSVKKQLVDANSNMRLDHLTKALNRKHFDESLAEVAKTAHLTQAPVCLMIMDIDHFKKINDTYGHALGDYVLIECVKLLKSVFSRENDIFARIGGEEFAVILPDYRVEHAVKKAEQALAKIRSETLIDKENRIRFTISLGLAQLLPTEDVQDWMKRADQALYSAKNSGRDKYVVAQALALHTKAAV